MVFEHSVVFKMGLVRIVLPVGRESVDLGYAYLSLGLKEVISLNIDYPFEKWNWIPYLFSVACSRLMRILHR